MTSGLPLGVLLLVAIAAALPFPYLCPQITPHDPPTNARQLRADDISMVMAIGDSMTAAFTAKDTDLLGSIYEWRKLSWAIGGDPDYATTFNMFKYFNPSVVGGPVDNTLPIDAYDMQHDHYPETDFATAKLDAAVSMARLQDIGPQIEYLKNSTAKYYPQESEGWKLIVILIGANNLCCSCSACNRTVNYPDYWIPEYDNYLQQIYEAFPKSFVAVHLLLNISQVWTVMESPETDPLRRDYCYMVRTKFHECGCLDNGTAENHQAMDDTSFAYNEGLLQVVENWQAKNLSDFYVTAIPFLANLTIPDINFVAELDCFHPSWLAHGAMGMTLWNSLFVPYDQKPRGIPSYDVRPMCPGPDDFLQ